MTNLLFYALDLYMKGKDVNKLASMLKLKAGRLAREVPDSCLQVFFSLSLSRWSSAKYLLGGNASDQSHRFFSISSLG